MVNYYKYIHSPEWQQIRDRELRRANRCCEFCGETRRPLHIHHLNYDQFGNETSADLIVLCDYCHQDAHEFPKLLEQIKTFASRRQLPTSNRNHITEADHW